MDLRKTFGTDTQLEAEGVDIHLGEDAYITLARSGGSNVKYKTLMQKLAFKHRRAITAGTISPDVVVQLAQDAHAEAVVLGWRGIELDGEVLPYSVANCKRLFKECPEVWRIVEEEAGRFANYKREELSEAGNVSPMQ
jgi:hypothetical protein